jgi:hypothetical protein
MRRGHDGLSCYHIGTRKEDDMTRLLVITVIAMAED